MYFPLVHSTACIECASPSSETTALYTASVTIQRSSWSSTLIVCIGCWPSSMHWIQIFTTFNFCCIGCRCCCSCISSLISLSLFCVFPHQTAQHPNRVCFCVSLSREAVNTEVNRRAETTKDFALRSNCRHVEASDLAAAISSIWEEPKTGSSKSDDVNCEERENGGEVSSRERWVIRIIA